MDRFHAMFDIPKEMTFHFCIPLGYPAVKYGPSKRKPIAETTSWNRWGGRGAVGVTRKPALSFAAVPGRPRATIELAQEVEQARVRRALLPQLRGGLGALRGAGARRRTRSRSAPASPTSIRATPTTSPQTAAFIHEMTGGRFRFGVGVSHAPANEPPQACSTGQAARRHAPLRADLRGWRGQAGSCLPLMLATLRRKMVALAGEIAEGAVWANAARSHMAGVAARAAERRAARKSFFIGNMMPACIYDDRAAALQSCARMLRGYVQLPNYQSYWIEAGYAEEMHAIRRPSREQEGKHPVAHERPLAQRRNPVRHRR